MGIDFHRRLRDGFLSIADDNSERCTVIDANQSIETISKSIITLVAERFPLAHHPVKDMNI